jgi:hypothetical protein
MDPRKYALYGGIVMLAMGALALIPSLVGSQLGLPALYLDTSYGEFLGYFPMNIVNKVALIIFGAAGIGAASLKFNALPRSILWSKVVCVVMGIAAVLGLIPQTSTLFGYWPLFGGEIFAHAVFAILGGYFGFALGMKVDNEIKTNPNLRETFQGHR